MKTVKKAQAGKSIDSKAYLEGSKKRVKAVTDSAKSHELKKGIRTYDDYLTKKIKEKPVKKQRSGGKVKKK